MGLLDFRQDSIMIPIRYHLLVALFLSTSLFSCSGEEDAVASLEQEPVQQEPVQQEPLPTMSEQLSATLATLSEEERLQANPLAEQAEAAAKGAEDFAFLCSPCHGAAGEGDGPAAQALGVPPGDLTVSKISAGERYQILKNGVPGTAMQGFNAAISDNQTWQLIAFMDSLRPALQAIEEKPATEETSAPGEPAGMGK